MSAQFIVLLVIVSVTLLILMLGVLEYAGWSYERETAAAIRQKAMDIARSSADEHPEKQTQSVDRTAEWKAVRRQVVRRSKIRRSLVSGSRRRELERAEIP